MFADCESTLESPVDNSPSAVDAGAASESGGYSNEMLSTIIRFHDLTHLGFLDEALFSIAVQTWHNVEVVLVLQNADDDLERQVREVVASQPWVSMPCYKIVRVMVNAGTDGRTTLLNHGIRHASGRYLAFLDDDDVVYQHGYEILIKQLIDGGHAVAVGGCRRAQIRYENDHWFVQNKDDFFAWGRSRADLFRENFVPIHSYVIDRARLGAFDLRFDEAFDILEDYDFLLRLSVVFPPDFSQLGTPVCEYRIRLDGSNSIAHTPNAPAHKAARQLRAQQLLGKTKQELMPFIPIDELLRATPVARETLQAHPGVVDVDADVRHSGSDETAERERRVLMQLVQELYMFFERYPALEARFSDFTHQGWRIYKRLKKRR